MSNRLLCTFTNEVYLENTVEFLTSNYSIKGGRIFLINILDQPDVICTYGLELGNISRFPRKTILVHLKMETSTLYTIDALNRIIINEIGVLNKNHRINWELYKNSILLTDSENALKKLNTELIKIIRVPVGS